MVYQNRVIIGHLTVKFLLMEFSIFVQKRHFYHSFIDRKFLDGDFFPNQVIGDIFLILPDAKITLNPHTKTGHHVIICWFDHANPERVFSDYHLPTDRQVELGNGFER